MKAILITFLIFNVGLSFGQTSYSKLDSIILEDGEVFYSLEEGAMSGNKRIGDWSKYQFTSRDTTKRLAVLVSYLKNKPKERSVFGLDGKVVTVFDKKGRPISEVQYRYGKKVWSRELVGTKKTLKKTYYPDGQVSGEGYEVLVEIIAGCDAGMKMFVEEGVWKYYDTTGEPLDEIVKKLNKNVFKKV